MLIIDILYSLAHVISRVSGYPTDTSHFFIGLIVTIIGVVGAFLADPLPTASVVLMLIAAVAFFFLVGAWAIIPGIVFLIAIVIVFFDRSRARARA
jgi:cell division protein FtsW (lipid II flippase)